MIVSASMQTLLSFVNMRMVVTVVVMVVPWSIMGMQSGALGLHRGADTFVPRDALAVRLHLGP